MTILTDRALPAQPRHAHPDWCDRWSCTPTASFTRHLSQPLVWSATDVEVCVQLERDDIADRTGQLVPDDLGIALNLTQHGSIDDGERVFLTPGEARRLATQLIAHAERVEAVGGGR